jgi:hypothetical protein
MQTNQSSKKVLNSVSEKQLQALSGKKIFFAHQSVGFNIMDGVKNIVTENSKINFKIKETADSEDFKTSIFAHAANGKNMDWQSKIEGFRRKINSGIGENLEIAFLKFCYVDVTVDTDIVRMFRQYKKAFDDLKENYPNIKFIHLTAPLEGFPTGIKGFASLLKARIKPILGKKNTIYANNVKRAQFNQLIKDEYPQERIFDLARAESMKPNGQRKCFIRNGKKYGMLYGKYTYDGGHLNEYGKKIIAQKLLIYLSELM